LPTVDVSARATLGCATQTLAHRPEVDGLRALAVLPVILFHAGFTMFSGGYVGVDVFFVISGFLITSIILNEQLAGRFSIVGFYERRARRIRCRAGTRHHRGVAAHLQRAAPSRRPGRSASQAVPAQANHRRRFQKSTVYLTGELTYFAKDSL
jgi:hypothetical protein